MFDYFEKINKISIALLYVTTWGVNIYFISGIYYIIYSKINKEHPHKGKYLKKCNEYFFMLFKTKFVLEMISLVFLIPFAISALIIKNNILLTNTIRYVLLLFFTGLTVFSIPLIYVERISGETPVFLSIKLVFKFKKKLNKVLYIILIKYCISFVFLYVSLKYNYSTYEYWFFSILNNFLNSFIDLILFMISLLILRDFREEIPGFNNIMKIE